MLSTILPLVLIGGPTIAAIVACIWQDRVDREAQAILALIEATPSHFRHYFNPLFPMAAGSANGAFLHWYLLSKRIEALEARGGDVLPLRIRMDRLSGRERQRAFNRAMGRAAVGLALQRTLATMGETFTAAMREMGTAAGQAQQALSSLGAQLATVDPSILDPSTDGL